MVVIPKYHGSHVLADLLIGDDVVIKTVAQITKVLHLIILFLFHETSFLP
ncbi:MAG: hypothetical protein RMY64_31970 [Nostoc sp. DedQUE08]|nr:hypothetical protein [Nostoc sp. DedQUE08]